MYNFQTDKNAIPVFYVNKDSWTEKYRLMIAKCVTERPCYILVEPYDSTQPLVEITCQVLATFWEHIGAIETILRPTSIEQRIKDADNDIDKYFSLPATSHQTLNKLINDLCCLNGGEIQIAPQNTPDEASIYITHGDISGNDTMSKLLSVKSDYNHFVAIVDYRGELEVHSYNLSLDDMISIYSVIPKQDILKNKQP